MRRSRRRYDVAFYIPAVGPLLSAEPSNSTGGAETQIFLLARALGAAGERVCLIAYEFGRALESIPGVDIVTRKPYAGHQRFVGRLREAVTVCRTIARLRSDVVVARNAGPGVGILAVGARLVGSRFVYSSANVVDFDFARIDSTRRNRFLYELGLRLANAIVVQTQEQADLCRKSLRRTPVVIRSLAEEANVPPLRTTDAPFLWIGRFVWYKRPLAFVELARALPEARFQMIGVPVDESADIHAAVRAAAAETPNLELLAPRSRRSLLPLIANARAIVNTADFEGMPNIFLEGWARGVPALSLSHDPDGLIVRYGLGEFAFGSFPRFVDAARALWQESERNTRRADRCIDYVTNHHAAASVSSQWSALIHKNGRRRERAVATGVA